MNCDCTEKVSALIDGELSPAEAREIERHLLTCEECQETREDFLNFRSHITDFPIAFKPVAQREALDRVLGKQKDSRRRFAWRWLPAPAMAVVASLLIVGAMIAFLLYPKSKPAPVVDEAIATGTKRKPTPLPAQSPATQDVRKGQNKTQAPPANNEKSRTPIRKRPVVIAESPQDNIAANVPDTGETPRVRAADAETMTAIHFQKSELLLRSFRNVRFTKAGRSAELEYEKRLAQQLVYQNMMLRREADASGDAQVSSLLESLEPILLDIANLPSDAKQSDVRVIKDRVERKNIVALLQVNSTALARALD